MENEILILQKLTSLEKKYDEHLLLQAEQLLLQKEVLNFTETCRYLDLSESHLYKLTSQKQIPHYCPQGKRLYFRRDELDAWLQRNKQASSQEIDREASDYIIRKKRNS